MKTTTYLGSKNGMTVTVSDQPEPTPLEMTVNSLIIALGAYAYNHKFSSAEMHDVMNCIKDCADFMSKGYTLKTAVFASFNGDVQNFLINCIEHPRRINRGYYKRGL